MANLGTLTTGCDNTPCGSEHVWPLVGYMVPLPDAPCPEPDDGDGGAAAGGGVWIL